MKSTPIRLAVLILAVAAAPLRAGVGASRIAPADEADLLSQSEFDQIAQYARHCSNAEWLGDAKARLEALGKNLILVGPEADPSPDGDLCEVTLFQDQAGLKKAWRAVVARLHQLRQPNGAAQTPAE